MANADMTGGPGSGLALDEGSEGAWFGLAAYIGAGLSVVVCYAQILVDLLAPLLGGAPFEVNPHVQAVLMCAFALVAVLALFRDQRKHGAWLPLALGIAGLIVIAGTLYTFYDVRVLVLGYLLLVAAVLLNPVQLLSKLNGTVRRHASELADLNRTLEDRVEDQIEEIERLARLKRFLSSEVADLITTEGRESLLDSHRRAIACLYADVRNFTTFSEAAEPEEVMEVLQGVHERMGHLVASHGGTIGYRAGDGLMVIFNDPLPCEAPVLRAGELAFDMAAAFGDIRERWRQRGHELGLGIGIAYGYATLGLIGSEGRYDYTAIGNVVNTAARLCDRAGDGEILVDQRAGVELADEAGLEAVGALDLKGLEKPVETFRLTALQKS